MKELDGIVGFYSPFSIVLELIYPYPMKKFSLSLFFSYKKVTLIKIQLNFYLKPTGTSFGNST